MKKRRLYEILQRVLGKYIAEKLVSVWRWWGTAHKLYSRNSAPIFVRTNHPILAISSDDWGSMFIKGNSGGESATEIEALSELLSSHADVRGRLAILNAYITTTLPDFDSIAESEFKAYTFYPTCRDRPGVVKAWLDGCKLGVFRLGFHGRDHFNSEAWLTYLREGNEYFLEGFREGKVRYREGGKEMMKRIPQLWYFAREYINGATFPSIPIPLDKQDRIIKDGVTAFKDMFGFNPTIFIAPGHCFDEITCEAVLNNKMFYIETPSQQTVAIDAYGYPISRCLHWGEKLAGGELRVLIRNAHYEPDWGESGWGESSEQRVEANQKIALIEIERAFRRGEPAILSTHAENYVGKPEKVLLNLKGLDALLSQIIARWPNVHFASSDELGKLIACNRPDVTNSESEIYLYGDDEVRKSGMLSSLFWTVHDFSSWHGLRSPAFIRRVYSKLHNANGEGGDVRL
jgi:hypothetical protein